MSNYNKESLYDFTLKRMAHSLLIQGAPFNVYDSSKRNYKFGVSSMVEGCEEIDVLLSICSIFASPLPPNVNVY